MKFQNNTNHYKGFPEHNGLAKHTHSIGKHNLITSSIFRCKKIERGQESLYWLPLQCVSVIMHKCMGLHKDGCGHDGSALFKNWQTCCVPCCFVFLTTLLLAVNSQCTFVLLNLPAQICLDPLSASDPSACCRSLSDYSSYRGAWSAPGLPAVPCGRQPVQPLPLDFRAFCISLSASPVSTARSFRTDSPRHCQCTELRQHLFTLLGVPEAEL